MAAATLLIIRHTLSPNCQALFEAVVSGASADGIEDARVVRRAALAASASDVLASDGVLLGTPANLGYVSGALKHFFDQIYYPCLDATRGRPLGFWCVRSQGRGSPQYGMYRGDPDNAAGVRARRRRTDGTFGTRPGNGERPSPLA